MEYSGNYTLVRDLVDQFEILRAKMPNILSFVRVGDPALSTKHEWSEFSTTPRFATMNGAISNTTTVTFTVDASNISSLITGCVCAIKTSADVSYGEIVRVSAIATTTITVTRGYGSSTEVASIADNSVLEVIGVPKLEGSSAGDDDVSNITTNWNATQIFAKTAKVTKTAQAVRKHGIENAIDFAVVQHLDTLLRDLSKTMIHGYRIYTASTSTHQQLGGLIQFVKAASGGNATSVGTALTSTYLNNMIEDVIEDGGTPDTILCNTNQARRISGWNSSAVRTVLSDTRTGGYVQDFVSDLGMLPGLGIQRIVADMGCPKDMVFVLSSSDLALIPLADRAWRDMDATAPGADYVARRILGEYTFEIKNGAKSHGCLYSLTV